MLKEPRKLTGLALVPVLLVAACDREDAPTKAAPGDPERPTPTQSARFLSEDHGKPSIDAPHVGEEPELPTEYVEQDDRKAEATFVSIPGTDISGHAALDDTDTGVRIEISITGAPAGLKALHIHQQEDCSNIEHDSMGGHFNPTRSLHGLPASKEHHLGDLGNIRVSPDGSAKVTITVPGANLKPKDSKTFVGRSIVLHESSDNGSPGTGNSGKAIACAPILDT
ncbi:MAG: superoxide dismutase family protein [Myxococcales bacterium]|nr:superoxide dismutase family protein [Myxococcales bacterium]